MNTVMRQMAVIKLLPVVYKGSVDLGQVDQASIAKECVDLVDQAFFCLENPEIQEHTVKELFDLLARKDQELQQLEKETATLKASIAAYKANSTRRKARK